ncbi:MAG: hypothetical protein RJB39_499 [Candidatus Parcubacteria bacterium]|jgi:hypothetical protein
MQPTQKSNVGPIVIVVVIIIAIIAAIALSSKKDERMKDDGSMVSGTNTNTTMTGQPNGNNGPAVTDDAANTGGNTDTNMSPSTRYVSPAGFTVYYPSVWALTNGTNNSVTFKDGTINGASIITLQPSGGTSVTSGNIKYEYDSFKKVWIKNVTTRDQGKDVSTPSTATPLFYTVDGSPVFAGATPKTNIVAFSTNTFLTVSLVGSKWGPVIDPLTKTVAVNGKKIDANTLTNLVNTMVVANNIK